jgi:D-threo-aldose 1-dehydrogenase
VATAIPGAQTVAEVEQNVAAVNVKIPTQLWAELKHEKLIPHDAPVP